MKGLADYDVVCVYMCKQRLYCNQIPARRSDSYQIYPHQLPRSYTHSMGGMAIQNRIVMIEVLYCSLYYVVYFLYNAYAMGCM